jgi:hypothetical protein
MRSRTCNKKRDTAQKALTEMIEGLELETTL